MTVPGNKVVREAITDVYEMVSALVMYPFLPIVSACSTRESLHSVLLCTGDSHGLLSLFAGRYGAPSAQRSLRIAVYDTKIISILPIK